MNGPDSEIISFGPFRLSPTARSIEKNGEPLALGDRALDILIVLVERAGEIVSHRELISRVWRGLVVSPGNLRVHMTGLRRALGDGEGDARYIANVSGQGYCFVAPIRRGSFSDPAGPAPVSPHGDSNQGRALPPVLARMVGRDDTVRVIAADLIADRFVTIVGPGGMGKTTVAVAVAHAITSEFASMVYLVDLGALTDPKLLAATVASTLGLTIQTEEPLPALMRCLRPTRMLLVLDNCEHVVEASAPLAELIFNEAPGVHILATSREALRVEGEHVYWLPPLESPPPDSSLSAVDVLNFPAVKLFVERAAASGGRFELSDANAPIVAGICGRLDGIALAIELAAGRVGTHGIEGTANLLDKRLGLHWQGRRTALPRHRTLHALLDWSYSVLPESERLVLRRLSIFVGAFTLEAAQAVAHESAVDETHMITIVDSLVAKSLVSTVVGDDGVTRYRLLETTRVYALERLAESGEAEATAQRHAEYLALLLDSTRGGRIDPNRDPGARSPSEHLGNVRAALEWCFGDYRPTLPKPLETHAPASRTPSVGSTANARNALGIRLAAASVPLFLELSLLSECDKWSSAALALLDDTTRGGTLEMVLQEARAISSSWTRGSGDDVRAAITRGLEIAQRLGEKSHRLRLLVGLHISLVRVGDFRGSVAVAEEVDAVAQTTADVSYLVMSDWLRGSAQHFTGDQAAAQRHFQSGFARPGSRNVQLFGLDYRVRALVTYARVLWLGGSPDRAMEIAREATSEAAQSGKPLNVCFSLLYTTTVFLWCGNWSAARDSIEKVMAHTNWHALPSFHATGLALKGELLIRVGDAEQGIALLSPALQTMRANRQNFLVNFAACGLAEGLATMGRLDEARAVIGDAIAEVQRAGEPLEMPELLRVQANVLLLISPSNESAAEDCLLRSLTCARRQSALAWELRTTLTLARLQARQGRSKAAHQLLSSVYGRFTEGFETGDLRAAKRLLEEFG